MRLLLDTCVALWLFEGNAAAIPAHVRERITNPVHEVFISAVSVFEVMIKYQLGKLKLGCAPELLLPDMIEQHDLDVIEMSVEDVFELSHLPLNHRDPFDRLLIAQARSRKMTLVTPDEKIMVYDVSCLWK